MKLTTRCMAFLMLTILVAGGVLNYGMFMSGVILLLAHSIGIEKEECL